MISEIEERLSLSSSKSVDAAGFALKARERVFVLIFGLATLLYLVQIFTPLRLTTDGISYLSFADSAVQGNGLSAIRHSNFYLPKGYPFFLFALMRMGWFSSATLVASNLIFLALALALSFRALINLRVERELASIGCLFTYLSYATVKHVTQAMSDFLFFFLAAFAFWLMTKRTRYRWLTVLPSLCAVEVRLLGLALFVPIAFLIWQSAARRPKVLVPLGSVLACSLAIGIWTVRRYFATDSSLLQIYGLRRFLWLSSVTHCEDFGQLIINVPWTKLPAWTAELIIVTGAAGLVAFFIGVIALYKSSALISFYLTGCAILILPWPYTDPRFWMPVMPYVVVAIWKAIVRIFARVPKWTLIGYTALFSLAGFGALGYSTWITFSGPKFPDRYGSGDLRSAYIARCSAEADSINRDALNLLRRYEWHCEARK